MTIEERDNSGKCYLCGTACDPNRYREHVPPQSWFPKGTNGLITVCCCQACNNSNSRTDEFLRLIMSLVPVQTKSSVQVWERALKNTVRGGRLKKEIAELRASMAKRRINGLIQNTIVIPGRPLRLQLIRITKGFVRHFYPSINYSIFEWDVTIIDQSKIGDSLNNVAAVGGFSYHERGDGAHRCLYGIANDDPDEGMWIHVFHDGHCCVVSHRKRKLGRRENSQVHFS